MRTMVAALVLLVVGPTILSAQGPYAGERVRIHPVTGSVVKGAVAEASPSGIRVIEERSGTVRTFDVSEIDVIERSAGTYTRFGRNFLIGVAATSGTFALLSAITYEPCPECWLGPSSRGEAFAWGALGGAIIGVPVGAIMGALMKEERWVPLTLTGTTAGASGGLTLNAVLGPRPGLQATIPVGGR